MVRSSGAASCPHVPAPTTPASSSRSTAARGIVKRAQCFGCLAVISSRHCGDEREAERNHVIIAEEGGGGDGVLAAGLESTVSRFCADWNIAAPTSMMPASPSEAGRRLRRVDCRDA